MFNYVPNFPFATSPLSLFRPQFPLFVPNFPFRGTTCNVASVVNGGACAPRARRFAALGEDYGTTGRIVELCYDVPVKQSSEGKELVLRQRNCDTCIAKFLSQY